MRSLNSIEKRQVSGGTISYYKGSNCFDVKLTDRNDVFDFNNGTADVWLYGSGLVCTGGAVYFFNSTDIFPKEDRINTADFNIIRTKTPSGVTFNVCQR